MVRTNDGKYKMTDKEKKLISKKRKQYLKENPEKHPWKKKDKFKSIPCEKLKKYLKKHNIDFISEFQPLYPERFFSIDIAFPDKKIGIEINGNQHYNSNGKLKEYYQERHDLISQKGWKLYEFHYSIVYNESIYTLIDDILQKNPVKETFDYKFWISNKEKRNKQKQKEKRDKQIQKEQHINNIHNKLNESNIDFSKLGWINPAAEIIGITPQKAGKWLQRNLPEFYEKCYKRKKPVMS